VTPVIITFRLRDLFSGSGFRGMIAFTSAMDAYTVAAAKFATAATSVVDAMSRFWSA